MTKKEQLKFLADEFKQSKDANLKKLVTVAAQSSKLTTEQQKKVWTKVEEVVGKLKKAKDEAEAKAKQSAKQTAAKKPAPKKPAAKKPAAKKPAAQTKGKRGPKSAGETFFGRARMIRDANPKLTWKEAQQEAKKFFADERTKKANAVQSALKNFPDFEKATKDTISIPKDSNQPAKPPGKRKSRKGAKRKFYWESRSNRSDLRQPPKDYPLLARGGRLSRDAKSKDYEHLSGNSINDLERELYEVDQELYLNWYDPGEVVITYRYKDEGDAMPKQVRDEVGLVLQGGDYGDPDVRFYSSEMRGDKLVVVWDEWDDEFAKGGRPKSAHNRDHKYQSDEPHEKAYAPRRKTKSRYVRKSFAKGGRPKSAHNRDHKYQSDEPHEKAYAPRRKTKSRYVRKSFAQGGKITKEKFDRYVKVQRQGDYNMLTQAGLARGMANLTKEEYYDIINNYLTYQKKFYPNRMKRGGKIDRDNYYPSVMAGRPEWRQIYDLTDREPQDLYATLSPAQIELLKTIWNKQTTNGITTFVDVGQGLLVRSKSGTPSKEMYDAAIATVAEVPGIRGFQVQGKNEVFLDYASSDFFLDVIRPMMDSEIEYDGKDFLEAKIGSEAGYPFERGGAVDEDFFPPGIEIGGTLRQRVRQDDAFAKRLKRVIETTERMEEDDIQEAVAMFRKIGVDLDYDLGGEPTSLTLMAKGGKVSKFDKLAIKVAENYKGKKVPKKYQKEYGKTYDSQEARQVGDKVAAKVYRLQKKAGKFARGGQTTKPKFVVKYRSSANPYGMVMEGVMRGRDGENLIFENRADAEAYAKENRTMDTHLYAEELIDYRLPFGEGGKVYRMMKRGGEVIVKDIFEGRDFSENAYPAFFDDYDNDGVLNADDAAPLNPDISQTVEQGKGSSFVKSFRKLNQLREEFDKEMYGFLNKLKKEVPDGGEIVARTKSPSSIIKKLIEKRLLDKKGRGLTDVIGTTVVVKDRDAVEEVRQAFQSGKMGKVEDFDDFYTTPQNGYRAYHFIVNFEGKPVEVQVKTKRQKTINELSHAPYKVGKVDVPLLQQHSALADRADRDDKQAQKEFRAIFNANTPKDIYFAK